MMSKFIAGVAAAEVNPYRTRKSERSLKLLSICIMTSIMPMPK